MHSIDADQQDPADAVSLIDVLGIRLRRHEYGERNSNSCVVFDEQS